MADTNNKDDLVKKEIEAEKEKIRGKDQCILRFLAYEEDYTQEAYDEIFERWFCAQFV